MAPLNFTISHEGSKGKQVASPGDSILAILTTRENNARNCICLPRRMEKGDSSSKMTEPSQKQPLLLYSSNPLINAEVEIGKNTHSMMVDRVENALEGGSTSREDSDQSMTDSDQSEEDEDMNDELGDDPTMEQAQEEL